MWSQGEHLQYYRINDLQFHTLWLPYSAELLKHPHVKVLIERLCYFRQTHFEAN